VQFPLVEQLQLRLDSPAAPQHQELARNTDNLVTA
jgi:hypothetical protein